MTPPREDPQFAAMPHAVRQLIDDVEQSGPLGTSNVIGKYAHALDLLAEDCQAGSAAELAEQALTLIDYFLSTRGRFTVAVANSFALLRNQLEDLRASERRLEEVTQALHDFSRQLELDREDRLYAVAAAGAAHLAEANCLLLYDYSSTVFRVVAALVKGNENLKLVVPESRTCNGGLPILRQGLELGCNVQLIPDVTLAHTMPTCDAVLVGVETFFSDGSFTNTVGSLTTAIVASHFAVPFYAVTDLTKADLSGSTQTQPQRDFTEPLVGQDDLSHEDGVETLYAPLERVPAELVTAYITEKGVVEPAKIWSVALREEKGGSRKQSRLEK